MVTSWQLGRVIILIIDGFGVGAAPDAADFADNSDCNTLGNVARLTPSLSLPNLTKLGLANITNITDFSALPRESVAGFYGKLRELSKGKDTQTGHWELMGLISNTGFPTYPHGFPREIIEQFISKTGCGGILGNKPASGTTILTELGAEHEKTGFPIIYTSGDSVFQIACHVDVVPLATLYKWCLIAREILQPPYSVGRVIARPFEGNPGSYARLQGARRDYAVPPPSDTLLDLLKSSGKGILGIGKIEDIFATRGITHAMHTACNEEGLNLSVKAIKKELDLTPLAIPGNKAPDTVQVIFTNLVDTDSLFGHRRDVKGYAKALIEIDRWLGTILSTLHADDLLIISSDHGNDPSAPGTDHTREYVPLLIYSTSFATDMPDSDTGSNDLGIRQSFADVASTVAHWLDFPWSGPGVSCLKGKV